MFQPQTHSLTAALIFSSNHCGSTSMNTNLFSTVSIYYFSPEDEEEPLGQRVKKKIIEILKRLLEIFCVWDCCWLWLKIQGILELIVFDPFVELFITLCIGVNTLFMAMDHHDMKPDFAHFLKMGNYVSSNWHPLIEYFLMQRGFQNLLTLGMRTRVRILKNYRPFIYYLYYIYIQINYIICIPKLKLFILSR